MSLRIFTLHGRAFCALFALLVALLNACSSFASRNALRANSRKEAERHANAHTPPVPFDRLVLRARDLARSPYVPAAKASFPDALASLSYDAYRGIRFRPEKSLWRGQPGRFEAQFFPLGFYYREPVQMFVVEQGRVHPVRYRSELFSYQQLTPPPPDAELGFSGVRLHAPLNDPQYRDEVVVFHGASYFRSLGRGQVYGLSARALALDTGEPTPEEFPRFSEIYLVRPGPKDRHAWVLALVESPRSESVFAFRIEPGDSTEIEVHARVFLRGEVKVLGIAPLTSMFFFGEESPARFGDFRPEVHDSDLVVMQSRAAEWITRPLRNPPRTTVSEFPLDSPRGFGLVQRDRSFESYQDLEARYQDRPSAWVEPLDDWGRGTLRLLEIQSELETDDNVALMWVPNQIDPEGLALRYRIHLGDGPSAQEQLARAQATRIAKLGVGRARFVVDFSGAGLERDVSGVRLELSALGATLIEAHLEPNPFVRGARAAFELSAEPGRAVELRLVLQRGERPLSETWSYLWQPSP